MKGNIIRLNAWDVSFEGKIKLLTPITAKGSLEGKIVLSQYIGLFQTIIAEGTESERIIRRAKILLLSDVNTPLIE